MVPEIKKILFTTDLSKNSRHAFDYAVSAADRYGASITILHVMEEISPSANVHLKNFIGEEDWQEVLRDFYKGFHPTVEDVEENADRASGERVLGKDPKTGRQVSVRLGRFGPMVR